MAETLLIREECRTNTADERRGTSVESAHLMRDDSLRTRHEFLVNTVDDGRETCGESSLSMRDGEPTCDSKRVVEEVPRNDGREAKQGDKLPPLLGNGAIHSLPLWKPVTHPAHNHASQQVPAQFLTGRTPDSF